VPERIFLTVAEVLAIHHQQIADYGGVRRVRDSGLPESAVFRPQTGYYSCIEEEAAALMESLANNHAFFDGNKRVAFAAAHTFLLVNGYDLDADPTETYEFMIKTIGKGEFRFALILRWIQSHITRR
jgi:death on curing protein